MRPVFSFLILIIILSNNLIFASNIKCQLPRSEKFYPLAEEPEATSILLSEHPALLEVKTNLFEEKETIDFEKREVYFERLEKAFQIPVWQYHYTELNEYLQSRMAFSLFSQWYQSKLANLSAALEKKKFDIMALQWEMPVTYPSWAQRILGKDPPRLSISGYEKIIVSYEAGKTEFASSNLQTRPSRGLVFDQENQFSITGSVGRLINLNIRGSTKQIDEVENPLKNFKIEYKGEGDELEDEIVQEVSAGATSFDMPKTVLSGYSESHQGLFGLKIRSKLGPVSLTSIASIEQGEAQKITLYPSGKGESSTQLNEKDFLRNKIFFLDTLYLQKFVGLIDTVPYVKQLQVWLSNERIRTEARASNTSKLTEDVYRFVGPSSQPFKLLKENRDYFLQPKEGWIRFDSITIDVNDEIGIYFVSTDSVNFTKGSNYLDTTRAGFNSQRDTLWILKPKDLDSTKTDVFPLMWRNVYSLPSGFDPAKFQIRVTRYPPDTMIDKAGSRYFSEILGLTDDKGNPYVYNSQIFDVDHGLLIFPIRFKKTSRGFLGTEPFANDTLGEENVNRDIYRKTGVDFTNIVPKFQIIMSGSTRKTTFFLGFGNIMQGTEILRAGGPNGTKLQRDVDYVIDYQMGQIDLISKRAQSADRIDVEYQSEALFMPQRKVFLGARAEMKLPFSDRSFIGTSILWQDAATRDRIPKINQEPYSKLLLDMNMQIDLEPEWMTKAVNLLPLITTDAKSSVSLEFEVAHSRTNPNTDKQAYVDDFEGAKETFPLGLTQASWFMASPPIMFLNNDSLLRHPPAWISYWYQPLGDSQTIKTTIWDTITDLRYQTQADKYEPTLNWIVQATPNDTNPFFPNYNSTNPWAGIMTFLSAGTSNREKDKYLEFYARNVGGGRLYIDIGTVSEDLCLDGGPPNGKLDLEDKGNIGIVTDSINIGLDGRVDTAEYYLVPNKDKTGWDTLRYWWFDSAQNKYIVNPYLPYPKDPSKDNFYTYSVTRENQKNNAPFVNGTEKDAYLNTEDLNGDGFRTQENVFRRFIDFNRESDKNFLDSNAGNYRVNDTVANIAKKQPDPKWHLYRIPLNDTITGIIQKIGSPKWNEIKYVRIWWADIPEQNKSKKCMTQFAQIQFVGNQWLEVPNVLADSSKEIKLSVSTVNTEENSRTYYPPPGVWREKDERGNLAKETSLSLTYKNIKAGDVAYVRKSLSYQALNLSNYDILSIMVHADTSRTDLWYFLRFGTDDSTYYESRIKLSSSGWKQMNIRLRELSDMKMEFQRNNSDTASIRISKQSQEQILSIRSPKGKVPNFANITWMGMGVARDSSAFTVNPLNGEIWVDEMKVSGIKALNGVAGRFYLTTKWADFMNMGVGIDYEDGSFRRMTETQMGLDNSQLSMNFNIDWNLDKFLPENLGINIPLGTRFNQSLLRPQIRPSSDIFLSLPNGASDGLLEMYKDVINMILGTNFNTPITKSRYYQTTSFQRDFWTGFDKKNQSNNPFVNLLLDRTSIDFSSTFRATQTGRGLRSDAFGGTEKIDTDTSRTYHGTLKYNLTPSLEPRFYKFRPFEQSKLLWLPDRIKAYEFSYLPTTLTFDIAEATYTNQKIYKSETNDLTNLKKLELDHRMNMLFDPINILNLSYNISVARNFDNDVSKTAISKAWQYFFWDKVAQLDSDWGHYGILYGERTRNQSLSLRFDPSFLDWLSHSFDYSANYRQNANMRSNDSTKYQNLTNDATFHFSSTLTFSSLFKNLSDALVNFKAVSSFLKSVEDAINKISFGSIRFDYNAKSSLRNDNYSPLLLSEKNISVLEFYKYQIGLSGKNAWDVITGNMSDYDFGGMRFRKTKENLEQYDNRLSNMTFSLSTSFNIPQPIDIQFYDIKLSWGRDYTVRPDTTSKDTTFTFPDFSVTTRSGLLNKLPFISEQVQGLQLSNTFNYSKKKRVSGAKQDMDKSTSSVIGLAPVIGIDGTLKKWPVNFNLSWNSNFKTDTSTRSQMYTETFDNNFKFGAKYEVSKYGGISELKILSWKIPVKGRFVAGAEAEYGNSVTKSSTSGGPRNETAKSTILSLTPHASYDFTDNITGQLSYSASKKTDKSQTTTSHIFSLSVEIRFNP
jgi:hypothetical protein